MSILLSLPLVLRTNGFVAQGFVEAAEDVLRIHQRHNPIQINRTPQSFVHPKQRRNIPWVGEPRGFEKDVIEVALPLHKRFDGIDAAILHRTANTPISQFEPFFDLLISLIYGQRLLDVGAVAELVEDDGDFLAVPGCEDVVEQGGFACAEVAWWYVR